MSIKAVVGPSEKHGMGLFAAEDVQAGDVLYWFKEGFDSHIDMGAATPEQIHFGYACQTRPGRLSICGDRAKWWNFADSEEETNSVESPIVHNGEPLIVASRDIRKGEELLIEPSSDTTYALKMEASKA
jgi:SET domain-containing protein